MRTVRTVLVLAIALAIAAPALAQKKERPPREKKAPKCPAMAMMERMSENLNLTPDQKAKIEAIAKEFGPKMAEAQKKTDVLTPEQKKAMQDAGKAAKEAGKKGKEARDAVDAAVKITDDQKAKMNEARKELGVIQKEMREQFMTVLTPEQKEQFKPKKREKKEKK